MGFYDSIGSIRGLFSNYQNTEPNPPEVTTKPRIESPIGASGRAHFNGFIQLDEYDPKWFGNNGLLLADKMWRSDADIKRDTLATWSPITSATWELEPYGGDRATDKDREAAEIARYALFEFMSPNLIAHLNEVGPLLIRSGYVDFEQIWANTTYEKKKLILPKKLDLRLPRTIWKFYQDDDGELTGVVQFLPNAANVYIPATELVHYRLQAEGDNWTGTSMYRHAWKHFYIKEKLEKLDAIGQERKAVGVPVVYPPTGASEETKIEIETILANLHVNEVGFILMPGPKAGNNVDQSVGWDIEIITFDSSSSNGIRESIDQQTLKCAGAFLADFLELGHHQVGARATAEVQEDPFLTAVKALSDLIVSPLQKIVDRIAMLNVSGLEGTPKLKMSMHDEASLSEISTYAQQLYMGEFLTPDPQLEDYFRTRGDFPPADPDIRDETQKAKKLSRERAMQEPQETAAGGAGEPADGQGKLNQAGQGTKIKPGPREPKDPDNAAAPGDPKDGFKTNRGPSKASTMQTKLEAHDAPWYENLLSQGKLKEAFDNARTEMETATRPAAVKLAAAMAARGRIGRKIAVVAPPVELQRAFEKEMGRLYDIGYATVKDELAKQHIAKGDKPLELDDDSIILDAPRRPPHLRDADGEDQCATCEMFDKGKCWGYGNYAVKPSQVCDSYSKSLTKLDAEAEDTATIPVKGRRKLKRRALIAAEHVTNEVAREVERAAVAGERSALQLQRRAEAAATTAVRKEALTNAAPSVNDGRHDAALAAIGLLAARAVTGGEEPAAIGKLKAEAPEDLYGIYTSVLDNRTCDPCELADDGIERPAGDPALEVPNPECNGGEFCRCTVVWVLQGAQAALES